MGFPTPSWGGENGFVEPRKWIAGGQEQFHGIAGLLFRDMRSRASTKFRNQARAVAQAIVLQTRHFADCENAL